jgi:hypothetical protein
MKKEEEAAIINLIECALMDKQRGLELPIIMINKVLCALNIDWKKYNDGIRVFKN